MFGFIHKNAAADPSESSWPSAAETAEDLRAKKAIILAAGRGQRLGTSGPKSLLVLDDRTILRRQIDALARVGCKTIVVVVGFEREAIMAECARAGLEHDLSFTFEPNEIYADTNTVYSMYLARRHMTEAFIALNADVVFPPDLLEIVQNSRRGNALAIDTKTCADEEVKVVAQSNGRISDIAKTVDPQKCLGEYIGVGRFSRQDAPRFAEALEDLVEKQKKVKDYYERALALIAKEAALWAIPFSGRPMIEIDFPEDLEKAHAVIVPRIEELVNQERKKTRGAVRPKGL